MRILPYLATLAAACTSSSTPAPDASSTPTDSCERYLSCLLIAAPQSYGAQLSIYGDASECWKTEQHAHDCAAACDASFTQISAQCTCTGTTCMAGGVCADAHEPNDDRASATMLESGAPQEGSICAASDHDLYVIELAQTTGLRLTMSATGGDPQASVLYGSSAIAALAAAGSTELPQLPAGTYYVDVYGNGPMTRYTIEATIVW